MKTRSRSILISLLVIAGFLGILAAIAIPNFMAWQRRENNLDKNMAVLAQAVQDYAITHEGQFPPTAADAIAFVKSSLQNPWTGLTGSNEAWMDGTANKLGIVGYVHVQSGVRVTGYGTKGAILGLPLSFGCFYPKNLRPPSLFFATYLERTFSIEVLKLRSTVGKRLGAPSEQETVQPQLGMCRCFEPLQ